MHDVGDQIIVFIGILVGLYLTPAVTTAANTAAENASAVVAALLGIVPIVWVALILGGGILYFRSAYGKR